MKNKMYNKKYKSHTVLEVGKGIVKEGLIFFFSFRVWYWVFYGVT